MQLCYKPYIISENHIVKIQTGSQIFRRRIKQKDLRHEQYIDGLPKQKAASG